MNSQSELLAVCTQLTRLVIIDQTIKYSLLLSILFTILISAYMLSKNHKKRTTYQQIIQKNLPQKLVKILNKHNLSKNRFLVIPDTSFTAETIGFFFPFIIFSQGIINKLSAKQLEAVILHEYHHYSYFHPILKFLSNVISAVFFFFPIIKELMLYFQLTLEISADRYAIEKMGTSQPLQKALLLVVSNYDKSNCCTAHFVNPNTRQRIIQITHQKYPRLTFAKKTILTSFTSLFFFLSLWSAQSTLAKMVDSTQAGRELRNSCSFLQCVSGCQGTLKLYSENKFISQ